MTKVVQELYTENYKTILRETKDLNKWTEMPRVRIRSLHTVKMSVLPTLVYRFKAILIKIPAAFFGSNQQVNFKIYTEVQRT